jgi:hypothetical protein
VFGTPVDVRAQDDDVELLMRIGMERQRRLETDPSEGDPEQAVSDAADEEAVDDPMGDAFVLPLAESEEVVDSEAPPEEETTSVEELIADYVTAYTREHLSPVVARGIRAYRAQGMTAMSQELKVTKAPTKTLAALLRFAESRKRIGVLTFDGLAMWSSVPTDLRMKIVASIQQMRWALKDEAVVVLMTEPGEAPEIDEAFSAATRVSWRFEELGEIETEETPFDRDLAFSWASASSVGVRVPDWLADFIESVPEGTPNGVAFRALGAVVQEASETGEVPSVGSLASALEAAAQESPIQ